MMEKIILDNACRLVWGVDVKKNTRERPHPYARSCYSKIANDYKELNMSQSDIARYFGGHNHAKVFHSLKMFDSYLSQKGLNFKYKFNECKRLYLKLKTTYKELIETGVSSDEAMKTIINYPYEDIDSLKRDNIELRAYIDSLVVELGRLKNAKKEYKFPKELTELFSLMTNKEKTNFMDTKVKTKLHMIKSQKIRLESYNPRARQSA